MALMMSKLYHALLAANVPEEKAREAAEEAAEFEIRLSKIDELATKAELEAAKNEILKWVIGFMGLQTITIIGTLVVRAKH
jgi:hypothetical protein